VLFLHQENRNLDVPERGLMALFCFCNLVEMRFMSKADELIDMLAPTVASLKLELLGIEFAQSGSRALLRLYIDVEGRLVNIEDCEAVSREVAAILDVNDPISSNYTLEVSSPGIDRPLFKPAHFARFMGEQAKVNLRLPQNARRRVQGKIVKVEGDMITIAEDKAEFEIAFDNVEKARLVPDYAAMGLAESKEKKPERGSRRRKDPQPD
jgi:ribosome maturation factor RimP